MYWDRVYTYLCHTLQFLNEKLRSQWRRCTRSSSTRRKGKIQNICSLGLNSTLQEGTTPHTDPFLVFSLPLWNSRDNDPFSPISVPLLVPQPMYNSFPGQNECLNFIQAHWEHKIETWSGWGKNWYESSVSDLKKFTWHLLSYLFFFWLSFPFHSLVSSLKTGVFCSC